MDQIKVNVFNFMVIVEKSENIYFSLYAKTGAAAVASCLAYRH